MPPLAQLLQRALAAQHAERLLLEGVVHEAVDDGVDAAVAVANELQHGHHDAELAAEGHKQQVHLQRGQGHR